MKKQMKKCKEVSRKSIVSQNEAITLISLVITIILLIILAGVAINLGLKENGLFSKAKFAKDKYINEQEDEQKRLNDLYSQVLVATGDDAQITISAKDLKELIQEEVRNATQEPTGMKTDVYMQNSIYNKSTYSNVTSMSNAFIKTTDENNNIKDYLSYSDEDGYTVLKSGWYFINMSISLTASTVSVDGHLQFYVNEECVTTIGAWTSNNR